jgi:DNA-binding LacI/PurR family transcriptional regulator
MSSNRLNRSTLTEQVAGLIRTGLRNGRWLTRMPGQGALSKEFGVSGKTVYSALNLLMDEGLLVSDGNGRGALITGKGARGVPGKAPKRMLRVGVLNMLPIKDIPPGDYSDLIRLMQDLEHDGHSATLIGFPAGKDPRKTGYLAKLVRETQADVWLVHMGTHEVLEWFCKSGVTALAMGGHHADLPIPKIGVNLAGGVAHAVRRLTAMGHRRIVFIAPAIWRRPEPGRSVKAFVRAMEEVGIRTSEFNLPEWEESREGLALLLDSLFRVTPPTALIAIAPHASAGMLGWLLAHGLRVPQDVSVVARSMVPGVEWCVPGVDVATMESDDSAFWRRVRKWVADVAEDRIHREEIAFDIKLVEGNSMGPPSPDRA